MTDWIKAISDDIRADFPLTEAKLRMIIERHLPYRASHETVRQLKTLLEWCTYSSPDDNLSTAVGLINVLEDTQKLAVQQAIFELSKEPPLLQCVSCSNTESCAGAMARTFNHGHCMFCGGYFKVVRA